jgi:hypothetical protein
MGKYMIMRHLKLKFSLPLFISNYHDCSIFILPTSESGMVLGVTFSLFANRRHRYQQLSFFFSCQSTVQKRS